MTGVMRARVLVLVALSAISMALLAPALAGAEATPTYVKESQQAYESQLKKGEIAAATFNKRLRSLRLTLKNGEHVLYRYPRKGSPALEAALKARHVPITVLTPSQAAKEVKPAKHKLRYIAGGILIVVIIVVAVVLLVNRRRERD
jgi:hypothetical protein